MIHETPIFVGERNTGILPTYGSLYPQDVSPHNEPRLSSGRSGRFSFDVRPEGKCRIVFIPHPRPRSDMPPRAVSRRVQRASPQNETGDIDTKHWLHGYTLVFFILMTPHIHVLNFNGIRNSQPFHEREVRIVDHRMTLAGRSIGRTYKVLEPTVGNSTDRVACRALVLSPFFPIAHEV